MTAKKEREKDMIKSEEKDIEVPILRSKVYQHLSPLFLYPDKELFSSLQGGDLIEELGASVEYLLGADLWRSSDGKLERELCDSVESFARVIETDVETLSDLEDEYITTFGHTISKECPQYETLYDDKEDGKESQAEIFTQTQELGDIAGFYRAFGLDVSDQVNERVDHISPELEFMSFLAYKEAYALVSNGGEKEKKKKGKKKKEKVDKVEICRDAQKKFLNDHLGRWVPLFTRRLKEKAKDGFYQRLALVTERFLAFETEVLGLRPLKLKRVTPSPYETAENCYACGREDLCVPKEESL